MPEKSPTNTNSFSQYARHAVKQASKHYRMATGAAGGDGLLRGMFEGCISGGDMGIKRRPYHKNCGCALHESRGSCKHSPRNRVVSYPIRRSWSEGCLSLMAAAAAQSPPCSSPSPAVGGIKRVQTQLVLCKEENDEGETTV